METALSPDDDDPPDDSQQKVPRSRPSESRPDPARPRFFQIYDALPPDAQQLLVQKQLTPLLDLVSKDRRKRATASAEAVQLRYARMPALNLKAKKAEIAALILELSRDSKRAVIKERSHREQLLEEAVDSLAKWLNDIWQVVFEFRANFALAHACLLFACDALAQIGDGCGGCRCSYVTMFVPVSISRSSGKVVKSFLLTGAHNLDIVVLWIWRDLFLTMLASDSKRHRTAIPDMLDDIRVLLGWRALEHLLRGGNKSDDRDEHDEDTDDLHDVVDDDDDQDYVSDEWSSICDDSYPRSFFPSHWSWHVADQQLSLRDMVHAILIDIFKVAPSGPLYTTMIAIAQNQEELEKEIHPLVMSVAGHSSENFSEALRVMALCNRADSLDALLKAHKYLLRPQDASSLQFAVLVMSSHFFYRTHAVHILEEELMDVTSAFRAAVRFSFCNIDSEVNKTELAQILALRPDSMGRRTRVTRWVKSVATPHVDNPHPMALAALMIGLPLPPGVGGSDEGDLLGYADLDGDDPEVEDLREEFRPNIKARLQGWVETASAVKGGPALLLKIYAKAVVDMPFLKAKDVAEEMAARMADRSSKIHVSDALEAFREFCEKQCLNLAISRGKMTARRGGSTAGPASHAQGAPPGPSGPTSSAVPPPVVFERAGEPIEDVD